MTTVVAPRIGIVMVVALRTATYVMFAMLLGCDHCSGPKDRDSGDGGDGDCDGGDVRVRMVVVMVIVMVVMLGYGWWW